MTEHADHSPGTGDGLEDHNEPQVPSDDPGGWKPLFWSFDGGANFFPTSWKSWALLLGGTLVVVLGANWLGGILGLSGG
ncbi:hypothetical protein FM113_00825 [Leucobacter sp. 7(1)]|uniref:hypothetical protein n=1 Tax=Leucobacter sp. 7(1) TaxID=1255613 RepID=UPI00097E966A|nr:hypothetical protein [Leucobacter sp. 7(1)]SJN08089.1 hypothetical protein FM113_00825 [Leucobacter sp. 7(1)]